MRYLSSPNVLAVLLGGAVSVWAQEPAFLRKDIVVPQQFGAGATGGPTTIGDFNNDGRPDILICHGDSITVLLNSRGVSFGAPIRTPGACGTVIGDFDGDGRLDMAAGNGLQLGRGDGTFLTPRIVGPSGMSPRVVTTADFNGDRRPDLVFYTGPTFFDEDATTPTTMHVVLGAGDGTFSGSWMQENLSLGLGIAITADFNRDGRADLAVTDGAGGVLAFLGQGNGTFQAPRRTVTGENTAQLLAADFNRDGLPDLASAASIALGKGDGTFANPVLHPGTGILNEAGMPVSLIVSAAADSNGDGHIDLAGAAFSLPPVQREVWVLPGRGDGTLLPPVRYAVGMWPQPVNAADMDGDGRTDLIANGPMSNTISLLLSRAQAAPGLRRAVSAASGIAIVSPGSLATLYAPGIASSTQQAQSPWPSQLAGASLEIRDSAGATHLAPLLYVSPSQANFRIPTGAALGEATLTVVNERGSSVVGSMQVDSVAPAIFAITGMPFPFPRPAASAIRVELDGSQTNLALINCADQRLCFPVALPDADDRPIFVSLYGTGFRGASNSNVTCTSDGKPVTIAYAGPQMTSGIDQINIRVPPGQRGLGTIVCAVNGVVANPVWL